MEIARLETEIQNNDDLQKFLMDQKNNDQYELGYYPKIYRTVPRHSPEYRQLRKKEIKLKKSIEYANKTIRRMKDESDVLGQEIEEIEEDIYFLTL